MVPGPVPLPRAPRPPTGRWVFVVDDGGELRHDLIVTDAVDPLTELERWVAGQLEVPGPQLYAEVHGDAFVVTRRGRVIASGRVERP